MLGIGCGHLASASASNWRQVGARGSASHWRLLPTPPLGLTSQGYTLLRLYAIKKTKIYNNRKVGLEFNVGGGGG